MSLIFCHGQGRSVALAAPLFALAALSAGCPGPEPSATGSGSGGEDAPATSSSTGAPGSSGAGTSSSGKGSGPAGSGGAGAGDVTGTGAGDPSGTGGEGGRGGANQGGAGGCDADVLNDPDNCGRCGRACSEENADNVQCEAGHCKHQCSEGYENVSQPGVEEPDDGCETAWRRVFVTEEAVQVPFGVDGQEVVGAEAADAICQALGEELGGEWRAWVSDFVQPSPAVRFVKYPVPYVRLDGEVVAMSFEDLVTLGPIVPIEVTESGESLFDLLKGERFHAWTGTDATGDGLGPHCMGWTNPSPDKQNRARVGVIGDLSELGLGPEAWTSDEATILCARPDVRLYCFEQ